MRKVLAALSAAALMLSVGIANAAEEGGKVKSVDESTRTLTLEDGSTYQLAEGVEIGAIKPGQEVKVSFEMKDGQKVADKVTAAE